MKIAISAVGGSIHRVFLLLSIGLILSFMAAFANAQTPVCNKLDGEEKNLAAEILTTQHPYDCCDDTIANCLKDKPTCALAWRLAENICRRVADKQDKEKITRGLSRRARSMLSSGSPAKIDLTGVPMVGTVDAPVAFVEYACARCPFCSKITPNLYEAVANGSLKGKAKMYFKTFPIRSHPFSKETGLGFMAAARMGQFWEFLLYFYKHFDSFCIKKQLQWAEAAGLDRESFRHLVADPETTKQLIASKKEGIVNKVDATPTFFINGRKYFGDMNLEELVDVVEEEYERIKGIKFRK